MLSGAQYRESLLDGRSVYYRGERLADITAVPEFRSTIDRFADSYDRFYEPGPDAFNPVMEVPTSTEAMRHRLTELHDADMLVHLTYQSYMSLLTAADRLEPVFPLGSERIRNYVAECKARDVRMVQCITDSKGDRSLAPAAQADPDQYLRIVERREDGVVIRGAKLHITGAAMAHEMMVMPTKRMKPGEEEYAIACGVPVNAPGVKIVSVLPLSEDSADPRDYPLSWDRAIPEGFVIFDDVFVPNDRIFLEGQTNEAAVFAHSLGLWERLGATSGQVNRAEQAAGLAQLIAEANGTQKISHIRDKINEMVLNATLLRATLDASIATATFSNGVFTPNELYINAAKVLAATKWATTVRDLVDVAGGSIVTTPSMADYDNPELRDYLDKYMAAASESGEYRIRLFQLIRNLTSDGFGGWIGVTTVQAGGGIYAQRLVMRNHFDMERAKNMALELMEHRREPIASSV
ncbi:4-hydroxyphenylacetate 3-hydroxylase N-terminal domain-containing protein [Homoserinimonas sp. A447]